MLNSQEVGNRMTKALEKARKNIRNEDPNRIMTRLAFDFMSEFLNTY